MFRNIFRRCESYSQAGGRDFKTFLWNKVRYSAGEKEAPCFQQMQTSMKMWCLQTQKKIHAIASQHYIKTPLKNSESLARIEVLTALLMRSWDFWDVTPCYWSIGSLHFKWLCPLHLQAYSVHQSNQFFMDCLFLKMKVTWSSGTSETTDPATVSHTRPPESSHNHMFEQG